MVTPREAILMLAAVKEQQAAFHQAVRNGDVKTAQRAIVAYRECRDWFERAKIPVIFDQESGTLRLAEGEAYERERG